MNLITGWGFPQWLVPSYLPPADQFLQLTVLKPPVVKNFAVSLFQNIPYYVKKLPY
jgi:hypothetical protein